MNNARDPMTVFEGRALLLAERNIDTDQIIPARFLTTTAKAGLGRHLFADWRFATDGTARADFVLNRPDAAGARVLVAGDNFGCGSSREHAAWALTDFGFQAVIAPRFADIFRQNALKNGLLPAALDADDHATLLEALEQKPDSLITVDLVDQAVELEGGLRFPFAIDAFARACLMNGVDEIGYILEREAAVAEFEARAR
jgi:3-isopropylmalate/(R)-2-methylmalate dehydratase small subunit